MWTPTSASPVSPSRHGWSARLEGAGVNPAKDGHPRPSGAGRGTRPARTRFRGSGQRARGPADRAGRGGRLTGAADVRAPPGEPADRGLRGSGARGAGGVKFGVVRFLGSCDEVDALMACRRFAEADLLWHGDRDLSGIDAVVVPGGFSYGDYLRVGAIARFSPLMESVIEFARDGRPVLGICNGFQVLCEAGLLPGALLPNDSLRFVCRQVQVAVENPDTPFTRACDEGDLLSIPVKHTTGRYYAPPGTLPDEQVVLRYAPGHNPNGSMDDVAGVCNEAGNVMGLMPHPEHAVDPLTGSADGGRLFESLAMVPVA